MHSSKPAQPLDEALETVASIWAANTGSTSRQFFQLHASSPAAANLARYDAAELRRAAATALRPGSGSSRLPLETWLGHMTEEDRAMDSIRMEVDRLERLISVRSQQGVPGITPDDLAVALERLRQRNAEFLTHRTRRPRPAKWLSAPSPRDIYVPVIAADGTELGLVALLSATTYPWQFSKSAASRGGRIFTHSRHGYVKDEADRTYVDGLSDVLDTVSQVIETHRGPAGGRVHISRSTVQCADCDGVIASIEVAYKLLVKPVGLCIALAARKAAQRMGR